MTVFVQEWTEHGLPIPENEYRFHATRKWRLDYAWPVIGLAVEIEGIFYRPKPGIKSRHGPKSTRLIDQIVARGKGSMKTGNENECEDEGDNRETDCGCQQMSDNSNEIVSAMKAVFLFKV
jgi:hypothetical protein